MKRKTAERGVAAVEFAIVLPVLLLLLFGIVEVSLALYNKAVITNASREAARAGIVLKVPKATKADIEAKALSYAADYLVSFSTAAPTVTFPAPNDANVGGTFGTPITVEVSYTFTGLMLGQMFSAFTKPIKLTATATMNNE